MRPVFIPQIGPPNSNRLGAAKNRRAPAGALEETPTVGSAAVLGRINPTTDRAHVSITQIGPLKLQLSAGFQPLSF